MGSLHSTAVKTLTETQVKARAPRRSGTQGPGETILLGTTLTFKLKDVVCNVGVAETRKGFLLSDV